MNEIKELIHKLHTVLNLIKGFSVGYGSDTISDGKFMIIYNGKYYAVKIVEYYNPSDSDFVNLKKLKYQI